jgi:hypothetical protein
MDSSEKISVLDVLPLAISYLSKPGNSVGGSLHVVIEDRNLEDSHLRFCISHSKANNDLDGISLAEEMLKLSKTQRGKLIKLARQAISYCKPVVS